MAEAKTREEMLADWWERWWEEDFSWEGLAKKSWNSWTVITAADGMHYAVGADTGRAYGAVGEAEPLAIAPDSEKRNANLQDYWRADPATGRLRSDAEMGEELIAVPGQPVFHRVHLPLEWQDKTPTGKADWPYDALDALVAPRLAAARETVVEDKWGKPFGIENPALFTGGVWLRAASHPQGAQTDLSALYDLAHFARRAYFSNTSFAGDAAFGSASFARDAAFESARFAGSANFNSASFAGGAYFGGASFAGAAYFGGASIAEDANFVYVSFAGGAYFGGASFAGDASFWGARFAGAAYFENAQWAAGGSFLDSRFRGSANFENAKLNASLDFDGMRLMGPHRIARPAFLAGAGVWFLLLLAVMASMTTFPQSAGLVGLVACVLGAGTHVITGTFGSLTFEGKDGNYLGFNFSDKPLASGQSSMRALRKVAREALNHELEAIAHAAELKYSRLRWGKTWTQRLLTKPVERFFSIGYEALADYGQSIVRPVLWLIALVPLMAATFYFMDTAERNAMPGAPASCSLAQAAAHLAPGLPGSPAEKPDCVPLIEDAMWQALDFSISNTFKPLSAVASGNEFRETNPLAFRLLYRIEKTEAQETFVVDGMGLGVRLIGIFQSILAILLVFLSGLAIKRRFQISA